MKNNASELRLQCLELILNTAPDSSLPELLETIEDVIAYYTFHEQAKDTDSVYNPKITVQ